MSSALRLAPKQIRLVRTLRPQRVCFEGNARKRRDAYRVVCVPTIDKAVSQSRRSAAALFSRSTPIKTDCFLIWRQLFAVCLFTDIRLRRIFGLRTTNPCRQSEFRSYHRLFIDTSSVRFQALPSPAFGAIRAKQSRHDRYTASPNAPWRSDLL